MNRTMVTAVNSMNQLQKQVDIIGHNIANIDTSGYKRRDVSFGELIAQQMNNHPSEEAGVGRQTPLGLRQSVGSKIAQTTMVTKAGSLKSTNRDLDLAFTKENQYVKVLAEEEETRTIHYTRNGALTISRQGSGEFMLVNEEGYPVLNENDEEIIFSDKVNEFKIMNNGTFLVHLANGTTETIHLGVVAINKPQLMEHKGGGRIGLPAGIAVNDTILLQLSGDRRNDISIQQGALEASNVEIGAELSKLMMAQRSMQLHSRSITLADQMMGIVNGIR